MQGTWVGSLIGELRSHMLCSMAKQINKNWLLDLATGRSLVNLIIVLFKWSQFGSVQSLSHVWLFVTPWTAAHQASLSITNSRSLLKFMSIELVMPANHLILSHPLLPPSIFPSNGIFSNESALHIRWPTEWSFSFNISPSNEYSGLISFRMDWLDLLEVQGTLKSLLQHHSSKTVESEFTEIKWGIEVQEKGEIYQGILPSVEEERCDWNWKGLCDINKFCFAFWHQEKLDHLSLLK